MQLPRFGPQLAPRARLGPRSAGCARPRPGDPDVPGRSGLAGWQLTTGPLCGGRRAPNSAVHGPGLRGWERACIGSGVSIAAPSTGTAKLQPATSGTRPRGCLQKKKSGATQTARPDFRARPPTDPSELGSRSDCRSQTGKQLPHTHTLNSPISKWEHGPESCVYVAGQDAEIHHLRGAGGTRTIPGHADRLPSNPKAKGPGFKVTAADRALHGCSRAEEEGSEPACCSVRSRQIPGSPIGTLNLGPAAQRWSARPCRKDPPRGTRASLALRKPPNWKQELYSNSG